MGRPATDKRERLVAAATERFHRLGAGHTSLADVAKTAGVPPGNVFYYFKSKNDLTRAVVDNWCGTLDGYLRLLEAEPDPWIRLQAFIEQTVVMADMYVEWGCPLAGLARDLRQIGQGLEREAPRTYAVQIGWIAAQFRAVGMPETTGRDHARFILSAVHGSILLSYAAADPAFIKSGTANLVRWLDGIRSPDRAPDTHHLGKPT